MTSQATPPLEGIRVLDLSTMIAAPVAASVLGDYGAEVIEVDDDGTGSSEPQPLTDTEEHGRGLLLRCTAPAMGVDEGMMVVGNEMARVAALVAARDGAVVAASAGGAV